MKLKKSNELIWNGERRFFTLKEREKKNLRFYTFYAENHMIAILTNNKNLGIICYYDDPDWDYTLTRP